MIGLFFLVSRVECRIYVVFYIFIGGNARLKAVLHARLITGGSYSLCSGVLHAVGDDEIET